MSDRTEAKQTYAVYFWTDTISSVFPCLYTQIQFLIQKVVNSTDTPTKDRILQTILQCVNRAMSSSITTPGQHDRNGKTLRFLSFILHPGCYNMHLSLSLIS